MPDNQFLKSILVTQAASTPKGVAQFEQTNYLEDLLQDLLKVQSTSQRENEEYQLTSTTDYPWDMQQQEDKDEEEEENVT